MFNGLLLYQYSRPMRLKSPCEIASDMTRRVRRRRHLISSKINRNNASFIVNWNTKFQLNLPTQTVVTTAFVRSLQNVKCPILNKRYLSSIFNN